MPIHNNSSQSTLYCQVNTLEINPQITQPPTTNHLATMREELNFKMKKAPAEAGSEKGSHMVRGKESEQREIGEKAN